MSTRLDIPFDIVQLLVEFSASSSLIAACSLSLVSHECQSWSDVYLFRFIVEPKEIKKDTVSNLLAKMCGPDASPRLLRARQHVRSLSWYEHIQSETLLYNLGHYLSLLPNVVQLCLWKNYLLELANDYKFDLAISHPNLRRVYTRSYILETLPAAKFDCSFWTTITHLQLEPHNSLYKDDSPFVHPLFANLNRLTHLAIGKPRHFGYNAQSATNLDVVISRVRSSFPSSLMLCLLCIEVELVAESTLRRITNLRLGNVDERIVLWAMPYLGKEYVVRGDGYDSDTFEVWCGIPDGKETFWEVGTSIQQTRKLNM
ncbi:hypothetical protein DL96DRAFT_1617016, partial [Flagelloscypha sp. PMI_526]